MWFEVQKLVESLPGDAAVWGAVAVSIILLGVFRKTGRKIGFVLAAVLVASELLNTGIVAEMASRPAIATGLGVFLIYSTFSLFGSVIRVFKGAAIVAVWALAVVFSSDALIADADFKAKLKADWQQSAGYAQGLYQDARDLSIKTTLIGMFDSFSSVKEAIPVSLENPFEEDLEPQKLNSLLQEIDSRWGSGSSQRAEQQGRIFQPDKERTSPRPL